MGLYSNLNDVSSDSIPLLLVAIFANCVNFLRSSLLGFLQSVGLSRFDPSMGDVVVGPDGLFGAVGSGLTGLIVLAEQLNANRVFRYGDCCDGDDVVVGDYCVVCLCKLREGEQVRKLGCRHVFHKECLDGWLFDHLNLTCPLCRSPLVSDERVQATERRVAGDLVGWFSVR